MVGPQQQLGRQPGRSDDPRRRSRQSPRARWIGFAGGVGFHGTDNPGSIGSAASHGCVRMHVRDVVRLYEWVHIGTPVYVR